MDEAYFTSPEYEHYEPEPDRNNKDRPFKKGRLTWGEAILQILSGIIILLAMATLLIQGTWQYIGNGMDVRTVSKELEHVSTEKFDVTVPNQPAPLQPASVDPPLISTPKEGQLFGYLHIPRFGLDWKKPIQEGTTKEILANYGAGHYSDTALPGQVGNSSYAGHRTPSDFGYLNQLRAGDQIIIETGDYWFIYSVTDSYIVYMDRVDVIMPDAAGVDRGVTLTTCDPMFSPTPAKDRLIVHGAFVGWSKKTDGKPHALTTGSTTSTQERINRTVETVSNTLNMPVTGVVSLCLFAVWVILVLLGWMVSHRRMRRVWLEKPSVSPFMVLWRIQAGWVPYRVVTFTVLWLAITFACWRWACPWVADNIPIFAEQTPSMA